MGEHWPIYIYEVKIPGTEPTVYLLATSLERVCVIALEGVDINNGPEPLIVWNRTHYYLTSSIQSYYATVLAAFHGIEGLATYDKVKGRVMSPRRG